MHVLIFISNSIFHFSLSFLGQNYDFSLTAAKKLLKHNIQMEHEFSLIFVIERSFFINFMTSFVDILLLSESIFLRKCCHLLEKKRIHWFIKHQLLNFPCFQPGELSSSCLSVDLNLSLSP